MPNALGMTFDQCVSRFSGVASISDPQAFCGSLERALAGGKSMSLKIDAVKAICPPCAKHMRSYGVSKIRVGGKAGVPTELRKAIKKLGRLFHVKLPILKTDAKAGTFTGWASVVTREGGRPIIDADGDIIPIADLEKAAQDAFLRQTGAGRVGVMHFVVGAADLVESMVVTSEKREKLGFGPGPEGWAVTFRTTDPELKRQIEAGELGELSIRGTANRIPLDGTDDDIALLSGLKLSTVELFSVVAQGASGDDDNRPSIVLSKLNPKKGKPVKPEAKKNKSILMHIRQWFGKSDLMKDRALGMNIEALNAAAEWDLNDLSLASGVPVETLEAIISGEAEPDADQLAGIAGAFGMEADDLMPSTDVESQDDDDEKQDDDEEEDVEAQDDEDEEKQDEEDEEAMKRHANLEKQNKDLAKRVAELEADKEIAAALVKAQAVPHIPGDEQDVAKVYMLIKSMPKKERELLEGMLTSANALIEKGGMLEEIGTRLGGETLDGSAFQEFEVLVQKTYEASEIHKSRGTAGLSAARIETAEKNPELYERMRTESN